MRPGCTCTPFLLATGLLLAAATSACAQDPPLQGVVWTQPDDLSLALADLRVMRGMGVEAVRTGLVKDKRTLAAADSLGLLLFQELPIEKYPASFLLDTLAFAQRLLTRAVVRSAPYQSARYFGLARASDTSVPEACAYFEALSPIARRLPDAKVFYSSAFITSDRCAYTVDFVLINALGSDTPAQSLRLWAHRAPAGLDAIGRHVLPNTAGLRHPHSPESQARYLETHLNALLQSDALALFVYRWRDHPRPGYPSDNFGLVSGDNKQRPAYAVMRGIYSGEQRVFAFAPGTPRRASFPWYVALGWLAIGVIGVMYHNGARFRYTVRRYFLAHNFYVDSVRDGREVLVGPTTVMLLVQSLCAGIFLAALTGATQHLAAFRYMIGLMPPMLFSSTSAIISKPWALISMGSLLYSAALILASLLVALLYWWVPRITMAKAYIFVVWPFWHTVPLTVALLAATTLPGSQDLAATVIVCSIWGVMAVGAVVRIMADLTRLDPARALTVSGIFCGGWLLLGLSALGAVVWLNPDWVEHMKFFWHLATRN